ncbi:ABC transporter ATP-binding protein [Gallintestinimicrobium propionicum]|uniref:ABC transporter ATP-binding protein/permease n=1 Tax=Gallintestinimicrobium propionicum TaxID=2981770 RepID=A0AAE3DMR3_9FIRM|nr:ABC transporter ATP-binding protein [Gallintestinimicrobium propionicum]MCC2167809.1 ABC transporter ATP-binding protein/permease [Gallintestinimicrobium propionicum]
MARNKYDVDEVLEDKFDVNQLKRLLAYLIPYRKRFVSVGFMMLSASAFTMLIPQFFQKVMDVCIPNKDMKGIAFYSFLTLLAAFYSAFSLRYKIKYTNQIGQQIIHDMRYDIFEHLQELPFSYYDDRPHGKIQVRVVNYVNSISDLLSNGILNTITDLCNLVFIIVFMLILNVRLTLVCLCGLPILAIVIVVIKKKQRTAWQVQSNKQSNLNAYIAESINGIRVTQSFVREDVNSGIFNNLSGSYRKSWMRAVMFNFTMGPSIDIISIITTAAIYVLGVSWMINGETGITVGVLVAFTAYIGRFWAPINTLAGFYNSLLTAISYLERIFETIDEPVVVKDREDAVEMPPIHGDVAFDHVTFSYEPGVPILKDVSFHANQGQSFAVVGPTGAGKTTLVNLLSRFYNVDSGRILIDGIDIAGVTIRSLRKQMGVMMQDSFIFSGTIMDNIRYGNFSATDEEVIRAAKTVCAHDFIMEMENGYQTQVNERGSRLSAGQRQLISFARALLADPKILILDEATSSIDTETEIILQKGLNELLKGRTSFIIAHRLSTIKNSSCIMYVDKGTILEKGTHDELMAQKGEYYKLYMSQYASLM